MPITSQQMSGMIGGQQAMFGNFASYAQQISPGFQGSPPSYSNPMSGVGQGFAPAPFPMHDPNTRLGAQTMSAVGNVALPTMLTAGMIGGSLMGGPAGRFIGGLNPFSAGWRGMVGGAGLNAGGAGAMSNLGRIASGGVGSIARAGMGGVAGAAMGALPFMLAGQAMDYGVGQAVQGAQFQNQVQGFLDQNFRFQNQSSRSGYGFSRNQGADIAGMVREMGHSEMMTGPQELLRIMQSGTQQGMFRAVQDVKEFKKRFTDMVGSLKEIAKTMNTTLEGAMPLLSQARQMGFWTPTDISRHAQQARQTAAASGLSVSQTQQMMSQGAQMARSIGATGASGAQGMARAMQLVGGGLRGGAISEEALSEATGGLIGPQAVQSMAGTIQSATTRFARSRRARWALASMGQNGFTSLDPRAMQDMMSGMTGLRDIGRGARRNISEQGKFNFVNNERELRGQLLEQGPEAQLGFIRSMLGDRLYGDDPKNKLITRRIMKRNFGVGGKQADLLTKLAREAPELLRGNRSRGESMLDQQERDQDRILNRSWEGIKRKASTWWDKNVKEHIQKFGADMSKDIGDFYEKAGDALWGRTTKRFRVGAMSGAGTDALRKAAMGDTRAIEKAFGSAGSLQTEFSGDLGDTTFGSNEKMDLFARMGAKEYVFDSPAARERAMAGGKLVSGRRVGALDGEWRAFEKSELSHLRAGLSAAAAGGVSSDAQAAGLGFGSRKEATSAIGAARKAMGSGAYIAGAAKLAGQTGLAGRDLGERLVQDIEKGMYGSELKRFIGGAKTMADKVHRLTAAQDKERAGETGMIDLSSDEGLLKVSSMDSVKEMRDYLEQETIAAEGKFAAAFGSKTAIGGFGDVITMGDSVDRATVTSLSTTLGPSFDKAMVLMDSDDPDEQADARDMFGKMMGKVKDKGQLEVLEKLQKGEHTPEMKKGIKAMADSVRLKDRTKFSITQKARAERFSRGLAKRTGVQGKLDDLKTSEGRSIGAVVKELTGNLKPADYDAKMKELISMSGELDPDQIAEATQMLEDIPGGQHIVEGMRGGRQASSAAELLTGKGKRKRSAGVLSGMLGTKVKRGQVDKLRKGDQETVSAVLDSIEDPEQRKQAEEILTAMGKGETDLRGLLQGKAGARAAEVLGTGPSLKEKAQETVDKKLGGVIGALGSGEGMHAEMKVHSLELAAIREAVQEKVWGGDVKSPVDKEVYK